MTYRPDYAPRTAAEALTPTRLGTWLLRLDLIRRVAAGLSCEDACEMALAVGATIPGQTLRPRWLGSAWLHGLALSLGIWALTQYLASVPVVYPGEQPVREDRWDRPLAEASIARPLAIWKVCRVGLGIEHGIAPRSDCAAPSEDEPDSHAWAWTAVKIAAGLALMLLLHHFDHTASGVSVAAFTNFYIDTSGSNLNAGSVVTASASATSTNGDWGNAAANRFTAASGTPFSAVNVGDYASVYLDAATVTTYVAQVTAINGGGASIDLDATIKYGTAPATGATGRTCKIGGSWLDEIVLASTGLGNTTVPQSTKVNIKAATYTVAAARSFQLSGSATNALWFAGYNTAAGDLDSDTANALSKPLFDLNGGAYGLTFANAVTVSSLSMTNSRAGNVLSLAVSGSPQQLIRCKVSNTSSSASANTLAHSSTGRSSVGYCYVSATATAGNVINSSQLIGNCVGMVIDGGLIGVTTSSGLLATQCVVLNTAGNGVSTTTTALRVTACTFSAQTSDGIHWSGTPDTGSMILGSMFRSCGGYGINNASGTNTANVFRSCNDFYSCTSGTENGFGDAPAWFGQTDSADPVTSSTDMTVKASSNAAGHGFPGIAENETFSSYPDIGAVQRQVGAGVFVIEDD